MGVVAIRRSWVGSRRRSGVVVRHGCRRSASCRGPLTLEQVAAVIDAQRRLRDRFLFALLASTGMRIGQAFALRHEDVVSWERRIVIEPREGAPARARSKLGGRASVPVPGELMRLWSDYMRGLLLSAEPPVGSDRCTPCAPLANSRLLPVNQR
jgi:integrase